ncbi:unnamed protein product, partial [Iphiclides podalirius]
MTAKSFPEITAPRSNNSARSNISAHLTQPDPTNSAYEIVASWRQEDIPPRSIVSDDDSSFPGSPVSEVGRPSLLINSGKRLGVEMDIATREANEMLLRGKEALESAGKMKRECKQTTLDCLQSLYEMVLALSDSRSRHKQNLERERSRNAQELVRVERAHNKLVTGLIKDLASELAHARTDIKTNLQETKDVRSWLEYETRVPFQKATEAQKALQDAEKRLEEIHRTLAQSKKEGKTTLESKDITDIRSSMKTLANQIDDMRRNLNNIFETNHKSLQRLETITTQHPPKMLQEHLQPLTEHLEALHSELKTMREARQQTPPPPAISLATELAQAGDAKLKKPTYTKVVANVPSPNPNRTLIVSSTDPKKTGENVIEPIREALDTRKTGAKVDRIRKARNQKIILSCSTKEDLQLVQDRVKAAKGLKAEVAKASNPLEVIRDVLLSQTLR